MVQAVTRSACYCPISGCEIGLILRSTVAFALRLSLGDEFASTLG
jgi:hypothetical protein